MQSDGTERISFWQARCLQGFLVFLGCVVFLPPLWAVVYLNITGDIYQVVSSFVQVLGIALHPFPKTLITAGLIGLVLAFRSVTWGSISLPFTLASCVAVAFIMDLVPRFLALFFPHAIAAIGLGNEYFLYWGFAWLTAGLVFYGLLALSGFHSRYYVADRDNLRAAFWSGLVYVIYTPIIYVIILLYRVFGDELAMILARGPVKGRIEMVSLLMAALLAFCVIAWLRRFGRISGWVLFAIPFGVCLLFFTLYLLALAPDQRAASVRSLAEIFVALALVLGLIGCVVLRLLGVRGQETTFSSMLVSRMKETTPCHARFGLLVFGMIFVVAPPLWHSVNLGLRGLLIGFPPVSYFMANISLAFLHGGLIYGGLCGAYACWKGRIDYSVMFGAGLGASLIGAFFPGSYLGISFGFYGDYIAWPMLAFLVVGIVCWYILSCMKQIERR